MTEVVFYFNATDKWTYVLRLLRKAVQKGSRVAVTGEQASLQRLDSDLWTFSAVDFIPHCMMPCNSDVAVASPVVLCPTLDMAPHQQVLLNLGQGVPAGFERFDRLIEVIGSDDADRIRSRPRFKHYRDRGYAISSHEIAAKEVP